MRPADDPGRRITRRQLVAGAGGLAAALGLVACTPEGDELAATPSSRRQRGVDLPVVRPALIEFLVADFGDDPRAELAELGDALAAARDAAAGAVTTTVGVGPAVVASARGTDARGAEDLPEFAQEQIVARARDGDLMVQICADEPAALESLTAAARGSLRGSERWSQRGFRGETDHRGARNLLGFYDGVAVPETNAELDRDVWAAADADITDSTIAVVRRMRLDVSRFTSLDVARQEEIFGRERDSGAPLSGGTIDDDVDLEAKDETGRYDIALDAHVRRAHPLRNGAGALMMRRGYSYDDGADERGLLFVCFQRDLRTFVQTQQAMDESDALMDFALTTASGTFLVLPAEERLGDALWS